MIWHIIWDSNLVQKFSVPSITHPINPKEKGGLGSNIKLTVNFVLISGILGSSEDFCCNFLCFHKKQASGILLRRGGEIRASEFEFDSSNIGKTNTTRWKVSLKKECSFTRALMNKTIPKQCIQLAYVVGLQILCIEKLDVFDSLRYYYLYTFGLTH